jgi:hypothetical protein
MFLGESKNLIKIINDSYVLVSNASISGNKPSDRHA